MRRYREMRAAEKEKKRQKRLEAIRAVIKKRQDQMLIDDVLNRSSPRKKQEGENSDLDGEDKDLRSPTSPGLKKTQESAFTLAVKNGRGIVKSPSRQRSNDAMSPVSPRSPRSPRDKDKKKKGVNFDLVFDDR